MNRLNLDLSHEQEASPLNLLLCFLAGIHPGSQQRLIATVPEVAEFLTSNPLPENQLTQLYRVRYPDLRSDPVELFVNLVRNVFGQEEACCHFESTVEQVSLGDVRYANRLFFEVAVRDGRPFNERLFRESLVSSSSIQERVLFNPLNLVFRLIDCDTSLPLSISSVIELRPSVREFSLLSAISCYELVGVVVRAHSGAFRAFSLFCGEWRTNYQGRLVVCDETPPFSEEGTPYLLLYKMKKRTHGDITVN